MDDPRFSRIKKDPRFKSLPKKEIKLKINKRFNAIFKDQKFSTKPKFDVYGNKRKYEKEFQDHYEEEEQEEQEEQEQVQGEIEEEHIEESQEQEDNIQSEEASQVSGSVEEENDDSAEDISISSGVDNWEDDEQEQKNAPIIQKATKRLALQNYDWQQIKAKDLFVLFSSFLPQGSLLVQVQVFVSEFGKQKMAEENQYGPRAIFKDNFTGNKQKDEVRAVNELIVKGHDEDIDVDPIKLRQYEKDRLKYYYAVIEFDSSKTADLVYQQINGQEFELTNIKIDLRFIPNDIQLPEENLKQVCNTLPSKITSTNIVNRAVGHTDVKLTWEDSKPRTNFWNKDIKNLNKEDFEDLIGNYESDDEEKIKEDIKELVNNVKEQDQEEEDDWKNSFKKKSKSNLKITFQSGFNLNGANQILDRMPQRKKFNAPKEGQVDDFFVGFNEENNKNSVDEGRPEEHLNYIQRKKQRKQEFKQKKLQSAELALLVDENKKSTFTPNLNDKRFEAIRTRPEYAIDPTNKQFKKNEDYNKSENPKKTKLI